VLWLRLWDINGIQVRLNAGEQAEYKLQLPEETTGVWVRVREKISSPRLSPVLAVSGATECLAADKLHTTVRDVAWPTRNPWFSGDVSDSDDGIIAQQHVGARGPGLGMLFVRRALLGSAQ